MAMLRAPFFWLQVMEGLIKLEESDIAFQVFLAVSTLIRLIEGLYDYNI